MCGFITVSPFLLFILYVLGVCLVYLHSFHFIHAVIPQCPPSTMISAMIICIILVATVYLTPHYIVSTLRARTVSFLDLRYDSLQKIMISSP